MLGVTEGVPETLAVAIEAAEVGAEILGVGALGEIEDVPTEVGMACFKEEAMVGGAACFEGEGPAEMEAGVDTTGTTLDCRETGAGRSLDL